MHGTIGESRTANVANWVANARYKDFPEDTTKYAKALLLKTIAGMLAGSREPISRILNTYFADKGGKPEAGVIAGGFRTTVENAAYAAAAFAHSSELEDNELPSITSDYWMFPALFPLAQQQVSSGTDLIEAAIIAWEVSSRYCRAAPGSLYMQMHICPPSWFGPLGVAAAASRLLKLDPLRTEHAINMAASWGCGLGQGGSDTHFLESGHTAMMGVQSAYLAKAGATAELGSLELPNAFYSPVAQFGKTDLSAVDRGLGEAPYRIHDACVKKYSACTFSHTAIDSLGLLMKEHGLKNEDIAHVEAEISEYASFAVGMKPNPADLQDARFSVEFLLTEVLLNGGISVETFHDGGALTDPVRAQAKSKISVIVNPEFETYSTTCKVKVTTSDGRELVQGLNSWLGSPEHPLGIEGIRQVCRPYLESMLSRGDCDRVEYLTLNLEKQPDILELMDILTFARVGGRR